MANVGTGCAVFEASEQEGMVPIREVGGPIDQEAVNSLLNPQTPELAEFLGGDLDLLTSEMGTFVEVLEELYERLPQDNEESLVAHVDTVEETVGFVDASAEEYICCSGEAVVEGLTDAADFLGISTSHLEILMRSAEGRAWLFSGEDPSEWDPEEAEAEVGMLTDMWVDLIPEDEKEVLDRDVEEEVRFGDRDPEEEDWET